MPVPLRSRRARVRVSLGIELASTEPTVMLAGILIDGLRDWPVDQQADGVADDFNFLVLPQADGRCRLYGTWDVNRPHRFSGQAANSASWTPSACPACPQEVRSPQPRPPRPSPVAG